MVNSELTEKFFKDEDTHKIAKKLLGKILVRVHESGRIQKGKIVETEAYHGLLDRASHASKSRTKRNEIMFGQGGHYYVYLIYGMYWNLNIVTGRKESPSAILIRALEPIFDSEIDLERLSIKEKSALSSGPGRLCRWMGIDREFYGQSVENDSLYLAVEPDIIEQEIISAKRIGVDYAGESALYDWRYYIKGNNFVSKK